MEDADYNSSSQTMETEMIAIINQQPSNTQENPPPYTDDPESGLIPDALQNCPRCQDWHDSSVPCRPCGCNLDCSKCTRTSRCECNGSCAVQQEQNSGGDDDDGDCCCCSTSADNPGWFCYTDSSPCKCYNDCCEGAADCCEDCGDCGYCDDCCDCDCDCDCTIL